MEQKPRRRKQKPYDPNLNKRRIRKIEALQPNPLKKPAKKKPKKPAKKPANLQKKLTPQTQPRNKDGKFKKLPMPQRSFWQKLKAIRSGEMRQYIRRQQQKNIELEIKHVYGLEKPPRMRRRRKS